MLSPTGHSKLPISLNPGMRPNLLPCLPGYHLTLKSATSPPSHGPQACPALSSVLTPPHSQVPPHLPTRL